jgi:Transmembrane domain of unknown function (DUF3566)
VDQRVEPQSWVTEEESADTGEAADHLYAGDSQPVLSADFSDDTPFGDDSDSVSPARVPSSSASSSSSSTGSSLPATAPGIVPPGLPSAGLSAGSFGSGPGVLSPVTGPSSSPADSTSATVSSPVPPPYPAQITTPPGKPAKASPFSVLNKATKAPKAPKAPKPPKPAKPAKPAKAAKQPKITAEQRPAMNGAKPAARRAHLTVIRLEPWSVMKFSFMISLVGWVVLFVAVAALWWVLSKLGVFHSIEGSVSNLTSGKDSAGVQASNWFSASRVLGYTMLVGAINVILITALATVGSVVYNLVTHVAGGIEVTLKETD